MGEILIPELIAAFWRMCVDGVLLFADLCHVATTHVVVVITGRDHLHHMEWVSHENRL